MLNLIPYRIQRLINQHRIYRATRSVLEWPSAKAETADSALLEVHLLLQRADLLLGLVALKSLLRFDTPIAVTITDDGSLTTEDRNLIAEHVSNVRILDRYQLKIIEQYKTLNALYHSDFHMIAKLVHPVILGRCKYMVALDADTLFIREPKRIFEWAKKEPDHALYLHDASTRNSESPWLPELLSRSIESNHKQKLVIQHHFFNAGLLAYPRQECDLGIADTFLAWRLENLDTINYPNADVWFGEWTREQTAYLCMLHALKGGCDGLGDDYRIGGSPWRTFHHFLRAGLLQSSSLTKIQEFLHTQRPVR